MKLTYKLLENYWACAPALFWFETTYGRDAEVGMMEVARTCKKYSWVRWLIICFVEARTPEMIELYFEMNKKDYKDLGLLITYCKYAQTPEIVKQYLKWNKSNYIDLGLLITCCKYAQTPEMIGVYLEMNKGDYFDLRELITFCELAQTPEMKERFPRLDNNK